MTNPPATTIILGQDIFPSSPSFGKFALEYCRTETGGYFNLIFSSGSAKNLCILSGEVHEVDGRLNFLPRSSQTDSNSQNFYDQRLIRLLSAFAKEANSRLLLATLEVDEALDAADECIAARGKF